jgi:uncharacterized BrkB/YihY/UPF0761 family membrane protein
VPNDSDRMSVRERLKRLPPRLWCALFCYCALILVGLYVLLPARTREERLVLGIFLAVFAILAVKTVIRSIDNR